jgi:hypothetical protein
MLEHVVSGHVQGAKSMRSLRRRFQYFKVAVRLTVGIALFNAGPALAADDAMIKQMAELIQMQQEQIRKQQEQIRKQQEQNDAQTEAITKLQESVDRITKTTPEVIEKQQKKVKTHGRTETSVTQVVAPAKGEAAVVAKAKTGTTSSDQDKAGHEIEDKLSLHLYGWINKAFMVSDDGENTDSYIVDPGTASSRIGALGTLEVNDDLTIGTRLEFDYDRNRSSSVNQLDGNNVGDGNLRDRWVDLQVTSKRFGKLFIGKGSTASDSTSESDLSGTNVALYASLTDSAGSLFFFDKDADALSNVQINNVFTHLDGLGRDDRIRYDSPEFWGLQVGGSVISGSGGDVAVKYGAKFGEDFKVAAAAAWSDPGDQDQNVENRYSSSASILHSSGFNISLAYNWQELEFSGRDDPTELYIKLGYRDSFFDFGESRFSVDYAYHEDQAQNDDEATAVGFAFVQDIPQWGSEFYLAYRWHELERNNADFDDLSFFYTGWRLKF